MRRIVIIFTLLMTLSLNSFCQVSVVVKAGVNLSSYSGLNSNEKNLQEYKTGYIFSAGIEIPLVAGLYVEPALSLVKKGTQLFGKADRANISMEVNPTYIEVPIMMGYRFPILESVSLTLYTGPYFSYGFGGSWKYKSTNGSHNADAFGNTLDIEKNEAFTKKRWDYGVGVGAGIEVDDFLFQTTYALGLAQVRTGAYGILKNRGLAFSVGYRF